MRCSNCGNELKGNGEYCHICGAYIEELYYINDKMFKERINLSRIFLYLLVPIAGFISIRNDNKNKIAILISSIIGSFLYLILILIILISIYVNKNLTYTYYEEKANGETINMEVVLYNKDDTEGGFYISGFNSLNTFIQVDYLLYFPVEYELDYSGYGYWVRTRNSNVIELQFLSETLKLEIKKDYNYIVEDAVYKTYVNALGKSNINELLDGKKVTVNYKKGEVNLSIYINEYKKTFNYL